MKLRGIARVAAAMAATALLVGGLGTAARAEETPSTPASAPSDDDVTNIVLTLPEDGVYAATAPNKGCAGIDTGAAVPGVDGWLVSKPDVKFDDIWYGFAFGDDKTQKVTLLYVTSDGAFTQTIDAASKSSLGATLSKKGSVYASSANVRKSGDLQPAKGGWGGKVTSDGAWAKSPAGLVLFAGAAFTDPKYTGEKVINYNLVRACAALPPASPSPSAGPSLPVTGTNVGMIAGIGAGIVALGAVLFVVYRRRKTVKFVA